MNTKEDLEKMDYETPSLLELYVTPNIVAGLSNYTDDGEDADRNGEDYAGDD